MTNTILAKLKKVEAERDELKLIHQEDGVINVEYILNLKRRAEKAELEVVSLKAEGIHVPDEYIAKLKAENAKMITALETIQYGLGRPNMTGNERQAYFVARDVLKEVQGE